MCRSSVSATSLGEQVGLHALSRGVSTAPATSPRTVLPSISEEEPENVFHFVWPRISTLPASLAPLSDVGRVHQLTHRRWWILRGGPITAGAGPFLVAELTPG